MNSELKLSQCGQSKHSESIKLIEMGTPPPETRNVSFWENDEMFGLWGQSIENKINWEHDYFLFDHSQQEHLIGSVNDFFSPILDGKSNSIFRE